ncbi:MAG TPA: metal-dependent hydrolase [Lachnospiraceae bacterium]|nr:metal-dependent hydrolase [Lachnospiraceae bacterium]
MDHTDYEITLIRSRRKSLAIEITPELQVVVRAPARMPVREINAFVQEKDDWIRAHLQQMAEKKRLREQYREQALSKEELQELATQAMTLIPQKVRYYAQIIGVTYGRITIRNQRTRWGSCSGKGNLNFNCLLLLMPEEVLDYVVVHELCHRKEMNHSARFWEEVEKILPDYRQRRKWLKDNGGRIMDRNRPVS